MKHRYSKHSYLVHGKFWTPWWDYSHHVVPPMSCSSTFRLETAQRGAAGFCGYGQEPRRSKEVFIYDRLDEPTRRMLEERLAYVEEGDICVTFASGMGAVSASLAMNLEKGDEVVAHRTLYGCTYSLLTNWLPRWGIRTKYIDLNAPGALRKAMSRRTAAVYLESPVNPTLDLIDIAAVTKEVRRARREFGRKIYTIVDNTFATPFAQRPLSLGADIVVHSLTKHYSGFGTDMGGAVITSKDLEGRLLLYRKDFGGVLSPRNAWNILVYGLPSLELRVRQEQKSALTIAQFLEKHSKVLSVRYPGLASHPHHSLAQKQMRDFEGGFAPGTMIYFVMRSPEAAQRLVNYVAKHAYTITLAVSLGQIRTLVELPGSMTHQAIPEAAKRGAVEPGGVRLSIGIEDPRDIIRDLEEALAQA